MEPTQNSTKSPDKRSRKAVAVTSPTKYVNRDTIVGKPIEIIKGKSSPTLLTQLL